MKARERQLREMITATEKRMNRADISDNDFVRLGRMRRDLLADYEELKGSAPSTQRTGLSEFEKKLKERERQRAAASGG